MVATPTAAPHVPVLLRPILSAVSPVTGVWLDGTFGAGGYARALLDAGAERLIGVDRDPLAFELAALWAGKYGDRLTLVEGNFANLDSYGTDLDGVVLDLGVSSMQLDRADRGFSFIHDGPLDMRMSQSGPSAADLINNADEATIADVLFQYGEERQSRRIARAIVADRPFHNTLALAGLIERVLGRSKPGQSHPATRSFQAIRIAVNDEFGALISGLEAAEKALKIGGKLVVVTFHSLEDRIVKRFLQARAASTQGSRYAPETPDEPGQFRLFSRKAISADDRELAENPRSRSAKLRIAERTDAPSTPFSRKGLGLPRITEMKLI